MRELLFAHPEPRRFGALLTELPGISRSLLSARLRELEAAGLVEAHTNGAARAINGWGLTDAGAALAPTLRALGEWGLDHAPGPAAADEGALRGRLSSLG